MTAAEAHKMILAAMEESERMEAAVVVLAVAAASYGRARRRGSQADVQAAKEALLRAAREVSEEMDRWADLKACEAGNS